MVFLVLSIARSAIIIKSVGNEQKEYIGMFLQRLEIFYVPQNINSEHEFVHQVLKQQKQGSLSLSMVKNPQLDY